MLLDELNVKDIRWAERRADFVRHEVRPIFPILGKRLGKRMPALKAALERQDGDALAETLERDGRLTIELDGEPIYGADIDPVLVRRRVGMVFQRSNPFPKSIFENVPA